MWGTPGSSWGGDSAEVVLIGIWICVKLYIYTSIYEIYQYIDIQIYKNITIDISNWCIKIYLYIDIYVNMYEYIWIYKYEIIYLYVNM